MDEKLIITPSDSPPQNRKTPDARPFSNNLRVSNDVMSERSTGSQGYAPSRMTYAADTSRTSHNSAIKKSVELAPAPPTIKVAGIGERTSTGIALLKI